MYLSFWLSDFDAVKCFGVLEGAESDYDVTEVVRAMVDEFQYT